ncbi:hypothetical protein B296_00036895 [Ensete ventricosum]|uniref:Uncharacterized protein n=1 Tax=Ensete ventricosum TaxID=4639 RepID=A0A426ZPH5_ENSVE|nr:hypothetical protein B296_00036895 [Ensete ventricosum]
METIERRVVTKGRFQYDMTDVDLTVKSSCVGAHLTTSTAGVAGSAAPWHRTADLAQVRSATPTCRRTPHHQYDRHGERCDSMMSHEYGGRVAPVIDSVPGSHRFGVWETLFLGSVYRSKTGHPRPDLSSHAPQSTVESSSRRTQRVASLRGDEAVASLFVSFPPLRERADKDAGFIRGEIVRIAVSSPRRKPRTCKAPDGGADS